MSVGLYCRMSSVPLLPSPSAMNARPMNVVAIGFVAVAKVPSVEVRPGARNVEAPSPVWSLIAPVSKNRSL